MAAIPLLIITLDLVVTPLVVSTIMKGKPFQFQLLAQQAKSVLALLAPKDVTETRLRVGRVSCAASGRPPGVSTVRASRRGHDADVILARGSQYSTQPASASHTFSTKLQLGKKGKKIEIDFR